MKTRRQILSVLIALTLLLSMGFFAAPPALADPIVAAAADDDSFRRPINSDNPLLMITVPMGHNYAWDPAFRRDVNYRAQDFKQIWTQIPEDVRPYVGLVLHFGAVYNRIVSVVEARDWIEHNVAAAGQLDIPVYLIYGGTRSRAMVTLNAGDPDIAVRGQDRWAFLRYLYETYPNFCGTTTSEQTGDNVVTDTTLLVELAAQYGGHHIYSSQEHQNVLEGGSQLNSQSGYDRMKAVGKHLIWVPKRMRNSNNYDDSLGMGMVLDGVAGGWGPYFDGYNWRPQNYFGYGISWADCRSRLMPELDSARYMIDAAMNGATVIHFENQMDLPATNSILTPLFWQSVLPAFRYMLAIDIPDREALFEMSNIAFSNHRVALKTLLTGGTSTTTINTDEPGCFDFYEGLYEILKGHNDNTGSNLSHFGRSSGRYGMIPILPKFASAATRARFEDDPGKLLLTSDNYRTLLPDLAAKVALFDTYYPEVSTGELTVQKGKTKDGADTWFAYNNISVEQGTQSAEIPLSAGSKFEKVELVDFTTCSLATIDDNLTNLKIHLNNFWSDKTKDYALGINASEYPRPSGYGWGQRGLETVDTYTNYAYMNNTQDSTLRASIVEIKTSLAEKPSVYVGGYDENMGGRFTYTEDWNPANGVLRLEVSHNGPLEISVSDSKKTAANYAEWTNVLPGDPNWKTDGAARSYNFYGTSVEWLGSIAGTANVYIDGVLVANGITGALPGDGNVMFSMTNLTTTMHTIKIDGGVIDSLRYLPGVVQMSKDLTIQDFTYGDPEEDNYNNGMFHANIVQDQYTAMGGETNNKSLKMITYVAPFWSGIQYYMTKHQYRNFVYEADVMSRAGTSIGLSFRMKDKIKSGLHVVLSPRTEYETANGGRSVFNETSTYAANYLTVVRNNSSDYTNISTNHNTTYNVRTWYRLRVTANGGNITVEIRERDNPSSNWVTAYTINDNNYNQEGYIGVMVGHSLISGSLCGFDSSFTPANLRGYDSRGAFEPYVDDSVYLDNVSIIDNDTAGAKNYSSNFNSWDSARDWQNEGGLVYPGRMDNGGFYNPNLSNMAPPGVRWDEGANGTWDVLNNDTIKALGDNGVYVGTANAGKETVSIAGKSEWADYYYDALLQFKSANGSGTGGLLFRVRDEQNMYKVELRANGTSGTVHLLKATAGAWTELTASKPFAVRTDKPGGWQKYYEVGVYAMGDRLQVFLDGKEVFDVRDNNAPYLTGKVGLSVTAGATSETVWFDNAYMARHHTTKYTGTPVAGIALTSPATAIDTDDGFIQFGASITNPGATDKTINWTVLDAAGNVSTLAKIDNTGRLTANGNGTVTVVAYANDGSGAKATQNVTMTGQSPATKSIVAFAHFNIYTIVDRQPTPPKTVTAYYNDGTAGMVNVDWGTVASGQINRSYSWQSFQSAYHIPNARFHMTGTVEGTTLKPSAYVIVMSRPTTGSGGSSGSWVTLDTVVDNVVQGEKFTLPAPSWTTRNFSGNLSAFAVNYSDGANTTQRRYSFQYWYNRNVDTSATLPGHSYVALGKLDRMPLPMTRTYNVTTDNAALGRVGSASENGTAANNAFDGNDSTVWVAAAGDGTAWLSANLSKAFDLKALSVEIPAQYFSDGKAPSYQMQTSSNGTAWNNATLVLTAQPGKNYVSINPVSASYIRVVLTNVQDANGIGVSEFKAFLIESPLAAIAASITSIDSPAVDATSLDLPEVPEGYFLTIAHSSLPSVIALNGTVIPPPANLDVTLILTVSDEYGNSANTIPIAVSVPAGTGTFVLVSSISVAPPTLDLIIGQNSQLGATVLPVNAHLTNVVWSSGNGAVATVDQSGLVTAVGAGSTEIRATAIDGSGVFGVCAVTVTYPPVAALALDKNSISMRQLETTTLTATVSPAGAQDKTVSIVSSDPDIVSVSNQLYNAATGVTTATLTMRATGNATITVTAAGNPSLVETCEVTVTKGIDVASVTLLQGKLNVAVGSGAAETLNAAVLPDNAADKTLVWTSSDPAVATVSASGVVTGVSAGLAVIRVASRSNPEVFDEITINVSRYVIKGRYGEITYLGAGNGTQGSTVYLVLKGATGAATWSMQLVNGDGTLGSVPSSIATLASVTNPVTGALLTSGTAANINARIRVTATLSGVATTKDIYIGNPTLTTVDVGTAALPAGMILDNGNGGGSWATYARAADVGGSERFLRYSNYTWTSSTVGGYAEYTFTGTGVQWIGYNGTAESACDVYIDGMLVQPSVSAYLSSGNQFSLAHCTIEGLKPGRHVVRIQMTGTPPRQGSHYTLSLDALRIVGTSSLDLDATALTWDTIKGENTSPDDVKSDLSLPGAGANGSAISWVSSNPAVVSAAGEVTPVLGDQPVVLTATITNGDASRNVLFALVVKPLSDKTSLSEAITAFEALGGSNYTAGTWAIAKDAYDVAQSVYANALAIQDAVNQAEQALWDALNALEEVSFGYGSQTASVVIRKGMNYQINIETNNPDMVFYVCSNANATVDANGLVTAVKTGSAVITVIDSWAQRYFTITINITS